MKLRSSEHNGPPVATRQQAWKPDHTLGWGKSWYGEPGLEFLPIKPNSRPLNGLTMLRTNTQTTPCFGLLGILFPPGHSLYRCIERLRMRTSLILSNSVVIEQRKSQEAYHRHRDPEIRDKGKACLWHLPRPGPQPPPTLSNKAPLSRKA